MKAVLLRPLAVFASAFYISAYLVFTAGEAVRLCLAVIFAVFLLFAVLCYRLKKLFKNLLRPLTFLCCGILFSCTFVHLLLFNTESKTENLVGSSASLVGTVTDIVWDAPYGALYTVELSQIDGTPAELSVNLNAPGGFDVGDMISGKASFSAFDDSDEYNERAYNFSKGILLSAESDSLTLEGKADRDIFTLAHSLNSSLAESMVDTLGEREGGFAAALLLGNKDHLENDIKRDFSRLGLSHILALSGMHLATICAAVKLLSRPFGIRVSHLLCLATVLFYMLITGFSPSVTRAGLMFIIMALASLLKLASDSFTNLSLAVFLICIADPYSIADTGLLLSFSCVFAILLYLPKRRPVELSPFESRRPAIFIRLSKSIAAALLASVKLSAVIVLFLLPLQWMVFGQMSVLSPLTSPLFSFACTLLLWSLPLLFPFLLSEALITCYSFVIRSYISFMTSLVGRLSDLSGIFLSIDYPLSPLFCILIFVFVILVCIAKKKKRLILALSTASVCALFMLYIGLYPCHPKGSALCELISAGSSEGIMVFCDGGSLAIDIGNGYSSIPRACSQKLKENRRTELDVYMLTHYHPSHRASLSSLFKTQKVRTLLVPDNIDCRDLARITNENGVELMTYNPGERICFNCVCITTFESARIERSEQPIIRLEISCQDQCLAYFGGAYGEHSPYPFAKKYDYIWLGDHGPLYKKEISIDHRMATLFASQSADAFLAPESLAPDEIILGNTE